MLFAVIAQISPYWSIIKIDPRHPLEYGEHTWTAWAMDDFLNRRREPAKVVFLGSSLMLTPLSVADAKFLDQNLDATAHHQSLYFNDLIKQQSGRSVNSFNFALPGEMPSDAFLITKTLLCGKEKPEMIVYGVGPRDFMDNLLASPTATDPYRCLSPLTDDNERRHFLGNRTFWDQLSHLIGEIFDPSNKRQELSTGAQVFVKALVGKQLVGSKSSQSIHGLLPRYHPMEIAEGESLFKPENGIDQDRFKNNLEEYRQRYRVLNWDTFLTQFNFLAMLLQEARLQNTRVVLVEMPVTSVNRQLIPEFVWNSYQASLRVITRSNGAIFVDLQGSNLFTDDDFGDTVHLNTTGGTKMLNFLAKDLSKEARLRIIETTKTDTHSKIAATDYSGL